MSGFAERCAWALLAVAWAAVLVSASTSMPSAGKPRTTADVLPATPMSSSCPTEAVSILEGYIAAQYNPAVGLYREAPNVRPNTYWVYSDGYLVGADISRWTVPPLRKWALIVEHGSVDETVLKYQSRELAIDATYDLRTEVEDPDAPLMLDWAEYADRLLFAAISAQNAGNWARANELIARADSMWNGNGMDDKYHQVEKQYQSYHVALYYYATGRSEARDVLLSLQEMDPRSNRYGGIYTEYGEDGRPFDWTDTNIETSATTLRALKTRCASRVLLPVVATSSAR
jgi:hypothetical protein